jgi:hypothetical protein
LYFGGKSKETEIGLLAAAQDDAKYLFLVIRKVLFLGLLVGFFADALAGKDSLHLGRALAGLRAVGLVDEDSVATLG